MTNERHNRDDGAHYNEGHSNFRQGNPYQGTDLGIGWVLQSSNDNQSNSRCLKTKCISLSQVLDFYTAVVMDAVCGKAMSY